MNGFIKHVIQHLSFNVLLDCRTGFILTASCDGHVKFWKKCEEGGIEFVKHFRSHLGRFDK